MTEARNLRTYSCKSIVLLLESEDVWVLLGDPSNKDHIRRALKFWVKLTHMHLTPLFNLDAGAADDFGCEDFLDRQEHLAAACEVPADALREANLYADGDEVPFGQTLGMQLA